MAGEAAVSGLRFFLDRGLGSIVVPGALRAAGWSRETMDERYGARQSQNIQDTQWIEEATLAGDVLLCKDLAIGQKPPGITSHLHDRRLGVRPVQRGDC
jgi:PIN like domain